MADRDVDIITLEPREQVRKRPGMWISTVENPDSLCKEIVGNAVDEYISGVGNEIDVTIKDDVVSVRDFGRGFEIGKKREEDGKSVLDASFSVILTSGKYTDDGVYSGSLGANGSGAKACCFTSEWFDVETYRDGMMEKVHYIRGILQSDEVSKTDEPNGTLVSYKPDSEIFDTIHTNVKFFDGLFNDVCYLCNDLTIVLNGKRIHHDSIDEALAVKDDLLDRHFVLTCNDINLAMTYTTSDTSEIRGFVNCGAVDGGVPITRLKTAITNIFNKFGREQGLIKEKEKNLPGSSLHEGLRLIFNVSSDNVVYDSQQKRTPTGMDMTNQLSEFTTALTLWLDSYPEEGRKIVERAIVAKKASDASRRARQAVKANRKRADKVKILHPDKLKDAEFLGEDSTLLCVEGK